MTQGYGTATDVDLGGVNLEVTHHGQGLGGEGLVQLEDVYLVDIPAGLLDLLKKSLRFTPKMSEELILRLS